MPFGADQIRRESNRADAAPDPCSAMAAGRVPRLAFVSEGCPQARVEGARPCRADGTWVREIRAAIGEIGDSAGIEEGSIGRIAVIEDIVRACVNLERLVDLIRGVEVENGIRSQPPCLIGFVADKVLTADEQRIASNLERVGDRKI